MVNDFAAYSDRELLDLIREAGSEQIRRAQERRKVARFQLRMPVMVA